ncbi:MAG: DNA methyltransferase [Acidimicrobiaceae bacterium]|nr:DNA methyltransferase [Acidimicrobiaceae bacterium]
MAASPRPPTNGAMNSLLECDAPAHDWYRFVLSFPPHLVRDYVARFELGEDAVVLDPFCGTGTTLVEAKKLGIPSIGVEAVPMSKFAAEVKTDWSPDPDMLASHAGLVAEKAVAALAADQLCDEPGASTATDLRLRGVDPDAAKLLIKRSISPLPLHKALVLREALYGEQAAGISDHERLAFARVLPTEVGNLRFGPEVGVGSIRDDAAVVAPWLDRVRSMVEDLSVLGARDETTASVVAGDARVVASCVSAESVDAVITSPPYPNEKDYSRTVRLESVLLGYLTDRRSLRSTKRELLRSNTRGVYRDDDDSAWVADDKRVQELAAQIEERRIALGKNSGFERMYHRVTKLYFGGMARHLWSLRDVLRPGARLAYVVGDQASYLRVMIRTGQILAGIAERAGYVVEDIDLFRTRPATATRDQLREEVLVLRWPGRHR